MSEVTLKAVQWVPGKQLPGVAEEFKIANPGDPEVTHGLILVPGRPAISLEKPAKVGEQISAGKAHIETVEGNTVLVFPGDWVLGDGKYPLVITSAEMTGLKS